MRVVTDWDELRERVLDPAGIDGDGCALGRPESLAQRRVMLSAFGVSSLFLVLYVLLYPLNSPA